MYVVAIPQDVGWHAPSKVAEKAFEYGIQGIILSNHGGRELD